MIKISQEQYLRWVRIGFYHLGAILMAHGWIANDGVWIALTGGAVSLATVLWTLYAGRLVGRINDLMGTGAIEIVVTKDSAISDQIESSKVVSVADVKNPNTKTDTAAISVVPKADSPKAA